MSKIEQDGNEIPQVEISRAINKLHSTRAMTADQARRLAKSVQPRDFINFADAMLGLRKGWQAIVKTKRADKFDVLDMQAASSALVKAASHVNEGKPIDAQEALESAKTLLADVVAAKGLYDVGPFRRVQEKLSALTLATKEAA